MQIYPIKSYNIRDNKQLSYRGKYGNQLVNNLLGTVDKPKSMNQNTKFVKNFIRDHFNIKTENADDILEALIDRIKESDLKNIENEKKLKLKNKEIEDYKRIIDKYSSMI